MHYIAYLDEFGHLGPYISRTDPHHNANPGFGLGGFVLPYNRVRSFATWFYQFKNALLCSEIKATGRPPYGWEKKGSDLFRTKTIERYPAVREAGNRLISGILSHGGRIFYLGYEKVGADPAAFDSHALYSGVLRGLIRRLETHFSRIDQAYFSIILDETDDGSRKAIVKAASLAMFGDAPCNHLLEPPAQVESRLYQTIQGADWVCGILGRCMAYKLRRAEYQDFAWAQRLYAQRIRAASFRSSILTVEQQNARRTYATQLRQVTTVETTTISFSL